MKVWLAAVVGTKNGAKRTRGAKDAKAAMTAEERRISIINTTTQFVAQHGFWGLRLREIAVAEDMTEAGLLYHFGSKEGLLLAVLDYRDKTDRAALYGRLNVPLPAGGEAIGDDDDFPVGLRDLTIATTERNAGQPEIVRLYTVLEGEALSQNHPAYEYFRNREQWVMREYTRAALNDGAADPERTARQTLAAMDGLQMRWLYDPESIDLADEWKLLVDKILR
ncbi:TetR family transcriptional regulator [Bifidobacterium cebidarum]|uniref:TetR family transcriptional regulator n=2 Tax=Bifidobacterium cebidarum TaxID=2650773 RepID=A0A6I1GGM8_9BIFI|nr:TetR family transcriptional regulator [Bifidobacterium cebidarum]